MMKFIPIGGNCGTAILLRKNLNLSDIALPFDYIRTNFECIVKSINNNFINFLPDTSYNNIDKKDEYAGDYDHFNSENVKIYRLLNHSFWHHNLDDINVINSFKRRIE